jgi:hypothetical protein
MATQPELGPQETLLNQDGTLGQYGQLHYHYTTTRAAFEGIMKWRWFDEYSHAHDVRLRFSPYGNMRDPAEAQNWKWDFGEGLSEQERVTHAYEYDRAKNRVRLLSLSEDAEKYRRGPYEAQGRGHARPRLWEHYGEGHRGVCLAFDAQDLRQRVHEWVPDPAGLYCRPIKYRDDLAFQEFRVDPKARPEQFFRSDAGQDAFFRKSLDWETEYEYRYVYVPDEKDRGEWECYVSYALRAIILGEKFPDWQVSAAINVGQEVSIKGGRPIEVLSLKWEHGAPKLKRAAVRTQPD